MIFPLVKDMLLVFCLPLYTFRAVPPSSKELPLLFNEADRFNIQSEDEKIKISTKCIKRVIFTLKIKEYKSLLIFSFKYIQFGIKIKYFLKLHEYVFSDNHESELRFCPKSNIYDFRCYNFVCALNVKKEKIGLDEKSYLIILIFLRDHSVPFHPYIFNLME